MRLRSGIMGFASVSPSLFGGDSLFKTSSFSALFQVIGRNRCVPQGRAVHARIIKSGFCQDVSINNHLLSMYVKLNLMDDAQGVFDQMLGRDVISWSALISGYSQTGRAKEALDHFRLMVCDGSEPNFYTYIGAVSACASLGDARSGKEIHGRIYRSCLEFNVPVSNSLVNFYGKCGSLESAQLIFNSIAEPNVISWTSLLSCYCQCGENLWGLDVFVQSRRAGVTVTEFSCASVLGACAILESLKVGMQMHSLALKCGFQLDKFVQSGLINLYTKCGELNLASQAFREADQTNAVVWTALLGGYAQQGNGGEAVDLFLKLLSSGIKPSEKTFSSVLGACAEPKFIEVGKQLHSLIMKMGLSSFLYVGNSLVDFYSKSGHIEESLRTFQEMREHDIVSWNSLMHGYIGMGHYEEAIELLRDLLDQGYKPNLFTYSSILCICGGLPSIDWGKQTHCCIIKPPFHSNVVVGSALVDMYAKCGMLNDARKVFDSLTTKNLVSWNTMIVGYSQHGFGREALEIYNMMQRDTIKPNDITFLGVLSACGHVGLVDEGLHCYTSMINDYGISPKMDHLASLVSLFARKGLTRRAYEFIRNFPKEPDKVVWRCLLSGCKIHKDVILGRYAAEKILSIDPQDVSAHVMLSNIYAEVNMWNEVAQVRKLLKGMVMKKDTGISWTKLRNVMYFFSAGFSADYEGVDLHEVLEQLGQHLFDAGYVSDAMFLSYRAE